jgi:hypothetical protein
VAIRTEESPATGSLKPVRLHWVYVIELDAEGLSDRDKVNLGKGALYVGCTATSPESRLTKHQCTERSAGRVFKRMTDPKRSWLRPDLAHYAGPWSTPGEALRNERRLHNRLVQDGYKVFGDRGRAFMSWRRTKKRTG